ncbi:MAG: hypothetical protein WDN46_17570 [Methylocella sp.]
MPRPSKGARLWPRPEQRHPETGKIIEKAQWVIRDGGRSKRTGCALEAIGEAEKQLADYITGKHEADRTPERRASEIDLADVLSIYDADIVAKHARPKETASRLIALTKFWGDKKLSDVNGQSCREYARTRTSQASARRELEDLRSAINHHLEEGLSTEIIKVVLPDKSPPRERWLTRDEAAKLIWAAWRYRETQKGHETGRKSRQHIARFILVGLYTGTRAAAICGASFVAGRSGLID